MKPIKGAQRQGTKGFFKGVGMGILGGLAIPITATLKFTSIATEGVSNHLWRSPSLGRVRHP